MTNTNEKKPNPDAFQSAIDRMVRSAQASVKPSKSRKSTKQRYLEAEAREIAALSPKGGSK